MNAMNAHDFRHWAADHAATRCIGSFILPSSLEREAVLAVADDELLAAVPYGTEAVIYHQRWDGERWHTQTIGEFPFPGQNLDALYDTIYAPCPRCGDVGAIWVPETNEAGHHILVDVPCPECQPTQLELPF